MALAILPAFLAVGCAEEGFQDEPATEGIGDAIPEGTETVEQGLTIDAEAYVGKNRRNPVSVSRQALTMEGGAGSEKVTLFSQSESDAFGSERWGAGYQARLSGTAQRSNFLANTRFEGYANTWGKIFGRSFGVATVTAVANTINEPGRQWAGIWYSVYVFGKKVKEDTAGGGAYRYNKALFDATQPVTPEYTQEFALGPVPVTVGAQAFAREYLNMQGTFWIDGFDGSLTPGAAVFVKTSFAAGVRFARAGLTGNLTLLDASLPITAKLKWGFGVPSNGQCTASLTGSCSASLNLKELNGTLDIFGQLGFINYSRRIAQWDAFQQNWQLFNLAHTWNLPVGSCAGWVPPAPIQS